MLFFGVELLGVCSFVCNAVFVGGSEMWHADNTGFVWCEFTPRKSFVGFEFFSFSGVRAFRAESHAWFLQYRTVGKRVVKIGDRLVCEDNNKRAQPQKQKCTSIYI